MLKTANETTGASVVGAFAATGKAEKDDQQSKQRYRGVHEGTYTELSAK